MLWRGLLLLGYSSWLHLLCQITWQSGKSFELAFPELCVEVRAEVDLLRQEEEAVVAADGGAVEEEVDAARFSLK